MQAAIEIVDAVVAAARSGGPPADRLIAAYFRERRYAGSGDKRAVRDLAYDAIRRSGEVPVSGRAALIGLAQQRPELGDLFTGEGHAPAPIGGDENAASAGVAPAWLLERLSDSGVNEPETLTGRAPLDLRVNSLRASVADVRSLLPEAEALAHLPNGLRLPTGSRLPQDLAGLVEVQDAGSQWVVVALDPKPGEAVIDLCAGAGGKTLAIAAAMGAHGTLIAADTDRGRLDKLPARARLAGAGGVEARLLNPGREWERLEDWRGRADAVLVDAPCSGTGTWRRNPEGRWRITPERLQRLAVTQAHLLDLASQLVRPGGRLTYAVCSVLDEEGPRRVAENLASWPGWRVAEPPRRLSSWTRGPGVRLAPGTTDTDGFFVATLVRPC